MSSETNERLRRQDRAEEAGMTPAERLRRSLEIGRRDLRIFMAANRLSRDQALEVLRRNHDKARRAAWAKRNR